MFIRWRIRKSKKNKPPKQPIWYEVNHYAYLRESARDKDGKIGHKKDLYLGSIGKLGGEFPRNRRAFFYLAVEEKLKAKKFSSEKIKEVFEMLRKKVPIPETDYLEEIRCRKEFVEKTKIR